jgi:hypothetical protein
MNRVHRKRMALSLIAACLAAILVYALALRPWLLRWGATSDEVSKSLPGDPLVPQANSTATRAITINAPPERVWPWIVQIGQGRGGLYSYAWLENLVGCDIVNAETIHPEWQDLKAGDAVRLHPKMPGIPVTIVERNRALVLGGKGIPEQHIPLVSWAFVLLEPIHFTMERKMMLGIRKRAEARRS